MAKKITLDLSVFKSSGIYTLEFDASENIILNPQTVRLVVGYSNTGPFNTPVYLPDPKTALAVFGDIDRSLEKKGSFFHRSIFTCLNTGPIFAINLLRLNNTITESGTPDVENGADVARYRAFSVDTAETNGLNSSADYSSTNADLSKQDKLLSSYYNREKFWFPDPNMLLATTDLIDKSKLFSFVNLSQKPVSIIIRKSLDAPIPIKGFDIMAKEYFGANNVPSFVHPYDYISDYFLDVIVVSGNWSNYQQLSLDPLYSSYFTPKGFVKSKLDAFLALSSVNIVLSVTGCLIPDFVDLNGIGQDLKVLINNQVGQTGILCAVNDTALDDLDTGDYSLIDLVGHHLINQLETQNPVNSNPSIDFLSYNTPLFSDMVYSKNANSMTDTDSPFNILEEVGTLYEPTLGNFGYPISDFDAYNSTSIDTSGYPYIQTAIGALTSTELTNLRNFLNPSNGESWIFGKITDDISGNVVASANFINGDLVKLKVEGTRIIGTGSNARLRITWSHPLFDTTVSGGIVEPWGDSDVALSTYQFGLTDYIERVQVSSTYVYRGYDASMLYMDYSNGIITDGDVIHTAYDGSTLQYVQFVKGVDRDGFDKVEMLAFSDSEFLSQVNAIDYDLSYISSATGSSNTVGADKVAIISLVGNLSDQISVMSIISPTQVEITSADATATGVAVGDLLVTTDLDLFPDPQTSEYGYRLTRIIEVRRVAVSGSPGTFTIYVKTDRPIKIYSGQKVRRFKNVAKFIQNYQFTYLPGFKLKATHRPDGSDQRVDDILNVLTTTNIAKTLADKNVITFRYVVDTFDGQIKTNTKQQLANLAKSRQKCMAILNAPSIKKFMESNDPKFTAAPTATDPAPLLDPRYIADGGNLSLNPSFTFTLPDEDNGAKFAGFFSPFITIRENNKNVNIPPAALVSNNFIRKFITGEPYSIVAGQKRGIISGSNVIGLEYDFSQTDRDYLEPMGINPIIRKRGIGIVIYGNQTSYQRTNSAFNNLHVRDLLITLEENVETILDNYVFDFNEDSVRLEIKTLVDNYLDGVKNVGGIYNYMTIMDSSNNTPAIIDQNIGIIDVIVEPARGIQKFINRMTVTRTGGINSGGFIQFG
jgi:hypothetical protein